MATHSVNKTYYLNMLYLTKNSGVGSERMREGEDMDQKEVTLFSLSLYYFGESTSEEKAWDRAGS